MQFYLVETLDETKPFEVYGDDKHLGYVVTDLDGWYDLEFFNFVSSKEDKECRDWYTNLKDKG